MANRTSFSTVSTSTFAIHGEGTFICPHCGSGSDYLLWDQRTWVRIMHRIGMWLSFLALRPFTANALANDLASCHEFVECQHCYGHYSIEALIFSESAAKVKHSLFDPWVCVCGETNKGSSVCCVMCKSRPPE